MRWQNFSVGKDLRAAPLRPQAHPGLPQCHRRPPGSRLQSQTLQGRRAKPGPATSAFPYRHATGTSHTGKGGQRYSCFGHALSFSKENKFWDKNYPITYFCIKEKALFFLFLPTGRVTGWLRRVDADGLGAEELHTEALHAAWLEMVPRLGRPLWLAQLSPECDKVKSQEGTAVLKWVTRLPRLEIPERWYATFPLQYISPLLTI